jgi:hypothetical protein
MFILDMAVSNPDTGIRLSRNESGGGGLVLFHESGGGPSGPGRGSGRGSRVLSVVDL